MTTAAPRLTAAAARNGAVIVTLASRTPGARVYYTVDGSIPTARSTPYETPFLLWANRTVRAVAQAPGDAASRVTSRKFHLNVRAGTLVWSDEFNVAARVGGRSARPDPQLWNYDTGADTNASVGILCAYGSSAAPCNPAFPNSSLGKDGDLHIIAQQVSPGVYTSANIDTRRHFSFQYGRLEARIWVPEGQGIWPAFWLLGDNVDAVGWPACGEIDIMERVNSPGAPKDPNLTPPRGTSDWNEGTLHGAGSGFARDGIGKPYYFTGGVTAAGWHTYGIIKSPGRIEFYVDDPAEPYATFTPRSIASLAGAVWPFDNGQSFYLILNIAVGGDWPGPPDSSTHFPATMRVDYVRLYSN